jgi:hypothetical protein
MLNNPFRVRAPLTSDDVFIGRGDDVELAVDTVCGGSQAQSIVFYGLRKSGKSSLLRAVERRIENTTLPRRRCVVARVEGRNIDNPSELCLHLVDPIACALGRGPQLNTSFETLARMADIVRNDGQTRVAVLIDDFDVIVSNPAFDVRIFEYLRSIISDSAIGMVLTARRTLVDASHSREVEGSPFFNVLQERWLAALPPAEVKAFFRLAASLGTDLGPHEAWIVQESGGLPWLLQETCEAAFDALKNPRATDGRTPTFDAYNGKADGYCSRVWRSLSDIERDALRNIIESGQPSAAVWEAAANLARLGLIERQRNKWDIPSLAFRRWLDSNATKVIRPQHTALLKKSEVFVSYAREDTDILGERELLGFLSGLERRGVRLWCDRAIPAGNEFDMEIKNALVRSDVVVCLVSQFWLNSEYVWKQEIPLIRQKLASGAHVVPVLVGDCTWQDEDWLARLQMLPPGARPLRGLTERGELEAAYLTVLSAIKTCLAGASVGAQRVAT